MGHYEDSWMAIYNEVEVKGLRVQFDAQVKKMKMQSKHDHKEHLDFHQYALQRVKGWAPNKSEKKQ
jgi:hypothetical protein